MIAHIKKWTTFLSPFRCRLASMPPKEASVAHNPMTYGGFIELSTHVPPLGYSTAPSPVQNTTCDGAVLYRRVGRHAEGRHT